MLIIEPELIYPQKGISSQQLQDHGTCAQVVLCCAQSLGCVRLFETSGTGAHQVTLCMEFLRQEYWSRLPFPTPESLLDPGIEPASPTLAGGFFTNAPHEKCALFIQKFNNKLMGAFENKHVHLSCQGYNELKSSRQGLLPIS